MKDIYSLTRLKVHVILIRLRLFAAVIKLTNSRPATLSRQPYLIPNRRFQSKPTLSHSSPCQQFTGLFVIILTFFQNYFNLLLTFSITVKLKPLAISKTSTLSISKTNIVLEATSLVFSIICNSPRDTPHIFQNIYVLQQCMPLLRY